MKRRKILKRECQGKEPREGMRGRGEKKNESMGGKDRREEREGLRGNEETGGEEG